MTKLFDVSGRTARGIGYVRSRKGSPRRARASSASSLTVRRPIPWMPPSRG